MDTNATGESDMSKESRRALHAYISPDAHTLWHDFGRDQGVSVSAVLEVFAAELALDGPTSTEPMHDRLQSVVATARGLDYRRRRLV
ncbi:MAG: hypothetical protein ACI8TP_000492 [Acidimicrobiales bacterium]|jgi:hypothetical protein